MVLRRAAELHELSSPVTRSEGLDRQQLEQIAAEAGIGPAALRRAIAESEGQAGTGPEGFITGRLAQAVFDVPLGHMPTDDVLGQLAAILEAALGAEGEVEVRPPALVWRLPGQHREIRVSVRPRPGGAAIRVEESLSRLGAALFGGIVGGVGGGLGGPTAALVAISLGSPAAAGLIALGALGSTYWWAKRRFVKEVRLRRFQLALVAHVLADTVDPPQ
jgi:hypothetical protein